MAEFRFNPYRVELLNFLESWGLNGWHIDADNFDDESYDHIPTDTRRRWPAGLDVERVKTLNTLARAWDDGERRDD